MSGAVINEADPERLRSATLENNMNRENVDSTEPKLDRRSVLGLAGAAVGASAASIAPSASAATQRSDIVMLDAVALSSAIHTRHARSRRPDRPRNERRSCRREPPAVSSAQPKDRSSNAGRCWQEAAKSPNLVPFPCRRPSRSHLRGCPPRATSGSGG